MRWGSQRYHRLGTSSPSTNDLPFQAKEASEDGEASTTDGNCLPSVKNIVIATVILFAVAAVSAFTAIRVHEARVPVVQQPADVEKHAGPELHDTGSLCGNSSTEAKALGCRWDQLLWAWLPPNCPQYANREFSKIHSEKPFVYYMDRRGENPVTGIQWDSLLNGEMGVYGEKGEHLTHCIYMFDSMGQIFRDGTEYAKYLVSYPHIHHCVEMLLDTVRKDKDWHSVEEELAPVRFGLDCKNWMTL